MTYSIVAYDPDEPAWGVAVASKFLAVGAIVPWVLTAAGAVATQSYSNVNFGPDGLVLMAEGISAQETLAGLLAADPEREKRQVGLVDAHGGTAAHTGSECHAWAGHRLGEGFTCQGNILTGPETLDAMAETFTSASGELADRLVAALLAGDTVGGDRRGKQSACVVVMRPKGGYGGNNDYYLDLRVDDHPEPVQELRRLLGIHHLYFGQVFPEDRLPIDADLARELQTMLQAQGYYEGAANGAWDAATQAAFWSLVGNENLEERWNPDHQPERLDRVVLEYLRARFKS